MTDIRTLLETLDKITEVETSVSEVSTILGTLFDTYDDDELNNVLQQNEIYQQYAPNAEYEIEYFLKDMQDARVLDQFRSFLLSIEDILQPDPNKDPNII